MPNAALRWRPRPKNVAPEARAAYDLSIAAKAADSDSSADADSQGHLWVKQGEFVRPVEVKVGLSDGVITQVEGRGVDTGLEVVVGSSEVQADADALSILPHARSGKK